MYKPTEENVLEGSVLGPFFTLAILKERAVFADRVPLEKVNVAVTIDPEVEQETDATFETAEHVGELGGVIVDGNVNYNLSVLTRGNVV